MKKSIVTIVAFMLFALASVSAFAGEVVVIRIVNSPTAKNSKVIIYEKGITTESEVPFGPWKGDHAEELKPVGDLLSGYTKNGFKIVGAYSTQYYREYILEKE